MPARRRPKGNPQLAVAYIRVSTDEQRLGPEAQRAALEVWARWQKVQIVSWCLDAGVSGGSELADRPALGEALRALRSLGAGILLVAKRDRLARDVAIAATLDRLVGQCGAKVVSADGAGNGDSPADHFL